MGDSNPPSDPATIDIDEILDLAGFQIFPAGANKNREKAKAQITDLITEKENRAREQGEKAGRINELKKVWSGMNTAAQIRDKGYSARNLNLDDLSYYMHGTYTMKARKRGILGLCSRIYGNASSTILSRSILKPAFLNLKPPTGNVI